MILTSPADGAYVAGVVPVTAAATDNVGVVRVQFFVDGAVLAEDTSVPFETSWDTSAFAEGLHSLSALATDTDGETGEDVVTVTVDLSNPSVAILDPVQDALVNGPITILIDAGDNFGVAEVEVRIDGAVVATLGAPPYEYLWTPPADCPIPHTIDAVATDLAGLVAIDSVQVIVTTACCGDGTCSPSFGENCPACAVDCCVCGDGQCFGEDVASCYIDCSCGDGFCDNSLDTCMTCPADCGTCCGNGTCEFWFGETCTSCATDCLSCFCGDGACLGGEDCTTCCTDCGGCACGDGCCSAGTGESCSTCPADCTCCGNGVVDPGETCDGSCPTSCADGDACTLDVLTGSAASCDVTCSNPPLTPCVGAACAFDADCPGGFCLLAAWLGWPGGYCSQTCMTDADCVIGSHCGADGYCLRGCTSAADCRAPEYECFDFDELAPTVPECAPVGISTGAPGDPCALVSDCAGGQEAVCFTAWAGAPGGYCYTTGCPTTACAAGSHCTAGTCLADCTTGIDCRSGYSCYDVNGDGVTECWL